MRVLLVMLLLMGLWSCTPRRPAVVDEVKSKPHRSQTKSNARHVPKKQSATTHKVVKGDSLYSIGFRYQKDYKTLAAINNIKPPYRIYPNQIIRLTGPEPSKKVFKPSQQKSNNTVQTQPLIGNQPISAQASTTKPAAQQPKAQPKTQATTQTNTQANNKPPNQTSTPASKPPARKPVVVNTPTNSNLKWLWPTQGKIRTTFLASNPARKGISIGGQEGQPVKAAEAGVVVYSGNGLLGYGELVIIKHNEQYLSAYGHNKSLKVKEGESVTRGQIIAELGSTGTNVNNLHFEIRKNGQPVNPLNYVRP